MQESDSKEPVQIEEIEVRITDINMPFWSMVRFMLKWALASIPAIIVLATIGLTIASCGYSKYNSYRP